MSSSPEPNVSILPAARSASASRSPLCHSGVQNHAWVASISFWGRSRMPSAVISASKRSPSSRSRGLTDVIRKRQLSLGSQRGPRHRRIIHSENRTFGVPPVCAGECCLRGIAEFEPAAGTRIGEVAHAVGAHAAARISRPWSRCSTAAPSPSCWIPAGSWWSSRCCSFPDWRLSGGCRRAKSSPRCRMRRALRRLSRLGLRAGPNAGESVFSLACLGRLPDRSSRQCSPRSSALS